VDFFDLGLAVSFEIFKSAIQENAIHYPALDVCHILKFHWQLLPIGTSINKEAEEMHPLRRNVLLTLAQNLN
jgi:hypothetical protein